LLGLGLAARNAWKSPSHSPTFPPVRYGNGPGDSAQELAGALRQAGWSEGAARRVADVYADWLQSVAQENAVQAQRQLTLLEGLGKHGSFMDLLERHPEAAGLLAGADPADVVHRTLVTAGADYEFVAGLYALH